MLHAKYSFWIDELDIWFLNISNGLNSIVGGPIGSEQIISAGGPLIGFIGLILFPLLWR